jgi:hypothetical protein
MAAGGSGTKEENTASAKKTESDAFAAIGLCPEAGVDVLKADDRGETALAWATRQGYARLVR